MLELIAEGPQPRQAWRVPLEADKAYILGRNTDADLRVEWDPHVSRRHVRLVPAKNCVTVERLPSAQNPLFFDGREVAECVVDHGRHFVIGETKFRVVALNLDGPSPSSGTRPVEEMTFDPHELRKVRFRDADKRIDVLAHLPEVIWGARSEADLFHRLVNLILAGVGHAEAVAIVTLDDEVEEAVRVLHWDRRRETAGKFHPSSRLVNDALVTRRRSVLHVWEPSNRSAENYTAVAEFDWAYCTPVPQPTGAPWGLYVAGKLDRRVLDSETPQAAGVPLQADVKFTELVAEIISTVQRLNKLEGQRAGYRQFFAPPILEALGDDPNTKLLEPRECDVTVLFCDLRGFSQQAEGAADDLIGLLDRVSRALGVMTDQILKHGGVTGDFQGDAALGFWGWPFASNEAPLNACRAALAIRAAFVATHDRKDHPLANFEMGIGIAHGRAVAGKIGTSEQVKVTVFGPVVNLANRLESMTKQLRVPILVDEATAEIVRKRLDPAEGRTRRLAKVLPYGMETPVVVSELLPPVSEAPELTDAHLRQYEHGVDLFIAGRWDEAYRCLHDMPAGDRAQDFLTMRIAQSNRAAPADWDGVVRMPSK